MKPLPLWILIVVIIVIYILWTENASQNCLGKQCHNTPEVFSEEDDTITSVDKISRNNRKNHEIVVWRRSMLVAIVASAIISVIIYRGIPCGFDYFMIALYIFVVVVFSESWFQAHWWKMNGYKIEGSLKNLRNSVHDS